MAALSAPGITSIQPPTVKLRGSCHACALSKLKCSQDKPTCARCIKRGTTCQYLASKRAGRKQGSRTGSLKTSSKTDHRSTTSVGGSDEQNDLLEASTQLMQYALQQDRSLDTYRGNHHHQRTPSYPESVPSLLSSAGPATSPTTPLTFGHPDFGGFLASPASSSFLDAPDVDYLSGTDVSFREINRFLDPSSFFPSGEPMLEDSLLKPPFTANSPIPQTHPSSSPPTPAISNIESPPQCFCFARSLALLRGLFPDPSVLCTDVTTDDRNCTNPPTIQHIITQNEQTVQEVSQMLLCPCSQDGYILTIQSLTVFKVLAWYSAVAQDSVIPEDGQTAAERVDRAPAMVRGYHLDGEDQGRMAAQLVLSELHRVQRLVGTLFQRLKDQASRGGLLARANGIDTSGHETGLPLHLLDKLALDLGVRLRGLSSQIVDRLRRG
ncbi:aflatoxin regulatory protein-domain-containing protein [Aspergillus varians]